MSALHDVKLQASSDDYYRKVAAYYDQDARDFLERYQQNHVLQRIRNDFRQITEQFSFRSMLEVGCGPGVDLRYFAQKYPTVEIVGIDVSGEMVRRARHLLAQNGLQQVQVEVGTVEDVEQLFPHRTFDMIYCYFGALNTVKDLRQVAHALRRVVSPNGTLVLTFVNRWYVFDLLFYLLRGNYRRAFSRITNRWAGYSPVKQLESTCRSAREIKHYFHPHFQIVRKKGYSIFFPAWYRQHRVASNSKLAHWLWRMDQWMNKTPFWNIGEYSLYVLKPAKGTGEDRR
ncbi:MAG: methyltransferase domain-containing protein [Calditrichaeota bacterium]|nr:methyltransferase domain-containing protein [Calditrichota bacterium]